MIQRWRRRTFAGADRDACTVSEGGVMRGWLDAFVGASP
jgi:hypothetical protein